MGLPIFTNLPREKLVFLALREVFSGANSHPKSPVDCGAHIELHQHEPPIAKLIKDYGFDALRTVALTLLKEYVFISKFRAMLRFPELFEPPPAENINNRSDAEQPRVVVVENQVFTFPAQRCCPHVHHENDYAEGEGSVDAMDLHFPPMRDHPTDLDPATFEQRLNFYYDQLAAAQEQRWTWQMPS